MNNGDIFQFYKVLGPDLLLPLTFALGALAASFPIGYITYGLLDLISNRIRRR